MIPKKQNAANDFNCAQLCTFLWEKRQRTRTGRGAHDKTSKKPDAGQTRTTSFLPAGWPIENNGRQESATGSLNILNLGRASGRAERKDVLARTQLTSASLAGIWSPHRTTGSLEWRVMALSAAFAHARPPVGDAKLPPLARRRAGGAGAAPAAGGGRGRRRQRVVAA
eukprot:gene9598-biopygen9271